MKRHQFKVYLIVSILAMLVLLYCLFYLDFKKDFAIIKLKEISHAQGVVHKIITAEGDITVRVFEIVAYSRSRISAHLEFLYSGTSGERVEELIMIAPQPCRKFGWWKTHFYLIITSDGKYGIALQKPLGNKVSETTVGTFCTNEFPIDAEQYNLLFSSKITSLPSDVIVGLPIGSGTVILHGIDLSEVNPNKQIWSEIRFGVRGVVVQPVSSELQPPDSDTDSGGKNDTSPDDANESFDENGTKNLCPLLLADVLNWKDEQMFITKVDDGSPGILCYNPFVSNLRRIGPDKQYSIQSENVTLYTTAEKKQEYSRYIMSVPEVSNSLDHEVTILLLNWLAQAIGDGVLCKETYEALSPVKKDIELVANRSFLAPLLPSDSKIDFELVPIAQSVKVMNRKNVTIPFIRYEFLFLMKISTIYTDSSKENLNNAWVLSLCSFETDFSDTKNRVKIMQIFDFSTEDERLSLEKNNNTTLEKDWIIPRPCIRILSVSPTNDKIRAFIIDTDFGNNNIYPYTDFATFYDCVVLSVSVNAEFSELVQIFKEGLPDDVRKKRIDVYNRALVGLTTIKIVGSP